MILPYVYLLHCIPTNQWYYGVRWANVKFGRSPEEDILIHYFTSSKRVKSLIKEYGIEAFEYEIRRTFTTVKDAREWETKLLRRMKVLNYPEKWLNRSNNRAILNNPEELRQSQRKWWNSLNDEERAKNLDARRKPGKLNGMYGTISPARNTHWYNNGKVENTFLEGKQPEDFKRGRLPCTEQHRQRTSIASKGRRWINNGTITRMIFASDPLPEGFVNGRGYPFR